MNVKEMCQFSNKVGLKTAKKCNFENRLYH